MSDTVTTTQPNKIKEHVMHPSEYSVLVTVGTARNLFPVEDFMVKGDKLVPVYDGGHTAQSEPPMATVDLIKTPFQGHTRICLDYVPETDVPGEQGICVEPDRHNTLHRYKRF